MDLGPDTNIDDWLERTEHLAGYRRPRRPQHGEKLRKLTDADLYGYPTTDLELYGYS